MVVMMVLVLFVPVLLVKGVGHVNGNKNIPMTWSRGKWHTCTISHLYLFSLSPLPLCLDYVELQSIWLLRAILSLSHFIYLSSEAAMNHKVSN